MSKPTQAKMLEEMNAKIADLTARLEKIEVVSEEKPKKKAAAKPAAKPKAPKKEVKVTAGAGAPSDEEESDEIKDIKRLIANSEKYIANEKGKYVEDKIELRKKQLVKEQAQLRKLMGNAPDDKKEETAPVQLSIEELQDLDLDVGDKAGKFWDSKNGRFVTGPDEDPDEKLTDQKFEGNVYAVGAKTYRVYLGASAENSFKGYAGVANFKDMVSESDDDE